MAIFFEPRYTKGVMIKKAAKRGKNNFFELIRQIFGVVSENVSFINVIISYWPKTF